MIGGLKMLTIFSSVLLCSHAMGSQECSLTRTYSCYLNDPLRVAVIEGDCDGILACSASLPCALDPQYILYAMAPSDKAKGCVLRIISEQWTEKLKVNPMRAIAMLLYDFIRLSSAHSPCRGNIDKAFMEMLDTLKQETARAYAQSPVILERISFMPCFKQPRALASLIGMKLARELMAERENVGGQDWFLALPGDLQEHVLKYMHQEDE